MKAEKIRFLGIVEYLQRKLDQNGLEAQKKDILEKYPNAELIEEQGSGQSIRPLFEEIIFNCKVGDIFVCTKLDRFCRSTGEGLKYIDELFFARWTN